MAIAYGLFRPVASTTEVPPAFGTFCTDVVSAQYTFVESTAMATGVADDTSVVAVLPPIGVRKI
jgi:hypothetical protein